MIHRLIMILRTPMFFVGGLLMVGSMLNGQAVTIGFQAGMGFSKVTGPSEMEDNTELEEFNTTGGFHVGATLNYKIFDNFGLRSGVIFNQRGSSYKYDGPSYLIVYREDPFPTVYLQANRETALKLTDAYIDIPVMAFYRAGPLEFRAGLYGSIMVAGTAGGETSFSNVSTISKGSPVDNFKFSLDYSFYADNANAAKFGNLQNISVEGENVILPTIIGAYYEHLEKKGSLIKPIDLGLIGGLSYYLNETFYIGFETMYGLMDISNNRYDYSLFQLDQNLERISREDNDVNLSFKFSIGFSF